MIIYLFSLEHFVLCTKAEPRGGLLMALLSENCLSWWCPFLVDEYWHGQGGIHRLLLSSQQCSFIGSYILLDSLWASGSYKYGFDCWPSSLRTEGCHMGQTEMEQAGRAVQFRILLSSVSGAVCFGSREEMSLWNQMEGCSSALPARWQSQKRALQAFGTGAGFLCHLPGFAAAESTGLNALRCPVQF